MSGVRAQPRRSNVTNFHGDYTLVLLWKKFSRNIRLLKICSTSQSLRDKNAAGVVTGVVAGAAAGAAACVGGGW